MKKTAGSAVTSAQMPRSTHEKEAAWRLLQDAPVLDGQQREAVYANLAARYNGLYYKQQQPATADAARDEWLSAPTSAPLLRKFFQAQHKELDAKRASLADARAHPAPAAAPAALPAAAPAAADYGSALDERLCALDVLSSLGMSSRAAAAPAAAAPAAASSATGGRKRRRTGDAAAAAAAVLEKGTLHRDEVASLRYYPAKAWAKQMRVGNPRTLELAKTRIAAYFSTKNVAEFTIKPPAPAPPAPAPAAF